MQWDYKSPCTSCSLPTSRGCAFAIAVGAIASLNVRSTEVPRGDCLFRAGQSASYIGLIKSGFMKEVDITCDGQEQMLSIKGSGDLIGYPFEKKNLFNMESITDCVICLVNREKLERILQDNATISCAIARLISHSLYSTLEFISISGSGRTSERIARLLLKLCDHQSPPFNLKFPVSRRDVAALLRTTPESLSRFVQELVRDDAIRIDNHGTIIIVDLAKIEEQAHQTLREANEFRPIIMTASNELRPHIQEETRRSSNGSKGYEL